MRMQPDFQSERPKIVEIIREGGHEVVFLPKFHCELNPIEMVWSIIKKSNRRIPESWVNSIHAVTGSGPSVFSGQIL
jgi:transposase